MIKHYLIIILLMNYIMEIKCKHIRLFQRTSYYYCYDRLKHFIYHPKLEMLLIFKNKIAIQENTDFTCIFKNNIMII